MKAVQASSVEGNLYIVSLKEKNHGEQKKPSKSSSYLVVHFSAFSIDPFEMPILQVRSADMVQVNMSMKPTCSSTSFPVALANPFNLLAAPPNASKLESISCRGTFNRLPKKAGRRRARLHSPFHHPPNQPQIDTSLSPPNSPASSRQHSGPLAIFP